VISPFRGDVVLAGFVLAIPVLLLAVRGDFTAEDVITRLLWCLGAGWVAVTLVRLASTPPRPTKAAAPAAAPAAPEEPAPAA
jgi:hypothetical protein